jgi:hypothetical protein
MMFGAVGTPEGPSVLWECGVVLEDCAEVGTGTGADSGCIGEQAASTQSHRCTPSVRSARTLLVHDCN